MPASQGQRTRSPRSTALMLGDDSRLLSAHPEGAAARCLISRLPDELLSVVFERAVVTYERSAVSVPELFEFRHAATCVCRKWYHVALRTPRLWRTLHTFGPECELLLDRSGAVPLHLNCKIESFAAFLQGDFDRPNIQDRLEYLSIASRREFNVYGSSPMDLYHVLNAIPRRIPADTGRRFPVLTEATLGPARLMDFSDLITIAGYASSLRRLRLRTITWAWYPQTTLREDRQHATFPHLEELELINLGLANVEEVLYFSELPKLARLLIIVGDDEGYKQLEHPIRRVFHGGSLVDLCMDTSHITLGDIIEILASLPTVEQLGLFRRPKSTYKQRFQELFHCLARKQGDEFPMLPNLKTLAHYDVHITFADLRMLVEAREHHTPTMKEVGFKEIKSSWFLDKDFKWLKKRVKTFEWQPKYLSNENE